MQAPTPAPMTDPPEPGHPHARVGRWPWVLGALAGLAVLLTLGDPGITSDEPIDVRVGRDYVRKAGRLRERVARHGSKAIRREELDDLFEDNAQHPPLGRWLVGLASTYLEPMEVYLGGADPMSVHAARLAPMLAFGLLVALVASEAGRLGGKPSAVVAGLALAMMPRVFAHAHFATLDTFLALFWTLALVGAARAAEGRRPVVGLGVSGILWGLALLTKIHAWFLPPLVLGYAMLTLPTRKAIPGVLAWGALGLAVFVLGWPWLWHDGPERLARFLSTGVDRQATRVLYFGRVFEDVGAPWHYPWVYFGLTVPIGLQALGALGAAFGLRRLRTDRVPALLLASILLFLGLFSTGAPVYDGERLFLLTFPSWAILIGLGFGRLWECSPDRRWRAALVLIVASQGFGVVRLHPFQLSYYNAAIGGLAGAERLGMELTYWGDAVDRRLLDDAALRIPEGSTVPIAPTFHHLQPIASMTPALAMRWITLAPEQGLAAADWLIVFRRSAYWTEPIRAAIQSGRPVLENARGGVWLARVYRIEPETGPRDDAREDSFRTN